MPSISTKRASAMWWGQIPPERDWNPSVVAPVEHERRHADRAQHRAHVDVEVADRVHRLERAGAQRKALEPRAPGERRRIVEAAPAPGFGRTRRSRVTPPALVELLTLAFGV